MRSARTTRAKSPHLPGRHVDTISRKSHDVRLAVAVVVVVRLVLAVVVVVVCFVLVVAVVVLLSVGRFLLRTVALFVSEFAVLVAFGVLLIEMVIVRRVLVVVVLALQEFCALFLLRFLK